MATKEEKLRELVEAKKKILEGSLTIWNARLETHVTAGNYEKMLEVLKSAVEDTNNGSCPAGSGCPCKPEPTDSGCDCPEPDSGCGSGCGSLDLRKDWLGEVISPAALLKKKELK
ncbi:MAG: hypothetical protein ACTFAK_16995 [Candidatus Electronema sp. VV]